MKLGSNWQQILKESTGYLKVFFMIGPPGVGKSHWMEHEGPNYGIENPYIISMDDVTDATGDKYGFDYDDMFARPIQPNESGYTENQHHEKYGDIMDQPIEWKVWEPKVWSKVAEAQGAALFEHDRIIKAARDSGRPVVVDMTNMNKGIRDIIKDGLNAPDHEMIAVVFGWNDDVDRLKKTTKDRAQKRWEESGRRKTIPPAVIDKMIGGYEPPQPGEFDRVIEVPAWWAQQ